MPNCSSETGVAPNWKGPWGGGGRGDAQENTNGVLVFIWQSSQSRSSAPPQQRDYLYPNLSKDPESHRAVGRSDAKQCCSRTLFITTRDDRSARQEEPVNAPQSSRERLSLAWGEIPGWERRCTQSRNDARDRRRVACSFFLFPSFSFFPLARRG